MRGLVVDTSLLLLLVVGQTSPSYISKHKRLSIYGEADFDLLMELLERVPVVLVTPNTLTETSNLLKHIKDPIKTELFKTFARLVKPFQECYVESSAAVDRDEFVRLGLADTASLIATGGDHSLLTVDANLYYTALKNGLSAINFLNERQIRGLI